MKKLGMMVFLSSLVLSVSAFAKTRVIYGTDDRLDLYEVSDNLHLDLARSTAAMIPSNNISKTFTNSYKIKGKKLEDRGMCKEIKFSQQMTAAMCSGFLVGDDLLVTAGHCLRYGSCNSAKWVFGYGKASEQTAMSGSYEAKSDDVYSCKKVLDHKFSSLTKDDYALVKLDRKVVGRTPLKFRTSGEIPAEQKLVVIGHPTGLPTKVASNAAVRRNTHSNYFSANLDTFGGNSGSAVFNADTGEVEGILVRGERDYVYPPGKNCQVPNVCKDTDCMGEEVSRITRIKTLMGQ